MSRISPDFVLAIGSAVFLGLLIIVIYAFSDTEAEEERRQVQANRHVSERASNAFSLVNSHHYAQDLRTGKCFAVTKFYPHGGMLSEVGCDGIPDDLLIASDPELTTSN